MHHSVGINTFSISLLCVCASLHACMCALCGCNILALCQCRHAGTHAHTQTKDHTNNYFDVGLAYRTQCL